MTFPALQQCDGSDTIAGRTCMHSPAYQFKTHLEKASVLIGGGEKSAKHAPWLVSNNNKNKRRRFCYSPAGLVLLRRPFKEPWPGSSATALPWKSHCSLSFVHMLGSWSKQNRTGAFVLLRLIMHTLAKSCSDKTKPSTMWMLTIVICDIQYLCCLDSQSDKGGICDKVR